MISKNKLKAVHCVAHGHRNKVYNDNSLLREANQNYCKNSEDGLHKVVVINSTEEALLTKRTTSITSSCISSSYESSSSSSSSSSASDSALSEPPLMLSSLSSLTSPTLNTVYNSVFVIFMPHGPRPLLGLDICYFPNSSGTNITKNDVNDTAYKRHNTFHINNYDNNSSNNSKNKNRININQSCYNHVNDKYSQLRQCVNRVHVRFDSLTHSSLLYIPSMTSVSFLQLPRHHMHGVFIHKNEIDEYQPVSLTRQRTNLHTSYSERPFHNQRSSPSSYLSTRLKQRQSSLSNPANQRWQHLLPSCVVIIQLNVIDSSSSNNPLEEMKEMSLATTAQHKKHVFSQHTHQLSHLPTNKKNNGIVNEEISPRTFSLFVTLTLRDTKNTYLFIASNTFKRLRISSHCIKFPLSELQITSHWYNVVFDLPQLHKWLMESQQCKSRNDCYYTCNGFSGEHMHEPELEEPITAPDTNSTKKFDSCNSLWWLSRHFSVEQINIEIAHGACYVRRIVAVKPNLTAELQQPRNAEVRGKTAKHPCKINSNNFEKEREQTEHKKHNLSHYLSLPRVEQLIPESLRLPLHVGSVKSIVVGLHHEVENEQMNTMQNISITKEVQLNKMETSQQDDTECKQEYSSSAEIAASLRTCLRPSKAEHFMPITSITSDASSESVFSIHLPPTHQHFNPELENIHNNNQTKYNNYLEEKRVNAKCAEKQTTGQLVTNDISANENNANNNFVEAKGNDYCKENLSTDPVVSRWQYMGVKELMARLRARISRINNVVNEPEWNDINNTESRMSNEYKRNKNKHSSTTTHEELTLESEQDIITSEQENNKREQSLHNLSDRNTIFVRCMSHAEEQLPAEQSLESFLPPEETNNISLTKEEEQQQQQQQLLSKFESELSEQAKLENVRSVTRKEIQEDELEEQEEEESHVEPELEVNKREVIATWARDVEKEMLHVHSQEIRSDRNITVSKDKEVEIVTQPIEDNSRVNQLERLTCQTVRRPVRRELTYSSMSVTAAAVATAVDKKVTLPSVELQNNISQIALTNNNKKDGIDEKVKTAWANALVQSRDVEQRANSSELTMYKTENNTNDKLPNPLQRSSFQFSDWLRLRRMREARAESTSSLNNDENIQDNNISICFDKKEEHNATCREQKRKDCKLALRRKRKITPSENDSVQLLTNTNISNVSSSVSSDKSEADDKVKIRGQCAKQLVYSSKTNLELRSNEEAWLSTLTKRTCPYISARSDNTINDKRLNKFSVNNAIITATRKIGTPCSLPLAKWQNEENEETLQKYVNLEKSQKFIVARRKSQTAELITHDNDNNGKTDISDKSVNKDDIMHKSTCSVSDKISKKEEKVNEDNETISAFTITSTRLNHLTGITPSPVNEWVNSFHLPVHLMQTSMRDVVGRYANMSTPSSFTPSQQTNMFTTTTTTTTTTSNTINADISKIENCDTTSSDVKHNMNNYNDHHINSNKSINALCNSTHASKQLEELRLEEEMATTQLTNTHIVNKLQNEKHDDLHKANALESSLKESNRNEYLTEEAYTKRNRVQPCKGVSNTWEIDKAANLFAFHYPVPQLYSESTTTCNESLSIDSGTQSIIDVVGSERMMEWRREPEKQKQQEQQPNLLNVVLYAR